MHASLCKVTVFFMISMLVIGSTGCSKKSSDNEAASGEQQNSQLNDRRTLVDGNSPGSKQDGSASKIEKPKRTLIFGEDPDTQDEGGSDQGEHSEGAGGGAGTEEASGSGAQSADTSRVLERNIAFLQKAGTSGFYPFDLVIGRLAPRDAEERDIALIVEQAEQFLRRALSKDLEEVRRLSAPAAAERLEVQVKAWPNLDKPVEEIRIGAVEIEDAEARFDFRIVAGSSRAAGSALSAFQDGTWYIRAVEFNGNDMLSEYSVPEYTDFPEMYGFFQ